MFYNQSDKGKTKKDYKQNSRNEFQIIIRPRLSHSARMRSPNLSRCPLASHSVAADDGFGGSQRPRV